jgi:hypothetical protein
MELSILIPISKQGTMQKQDDHECMHIYKLQELLARYKREKTFIVDKPEQPLDSMSRKVQTS